MINIIFFDDVYILKTLDLLPEGGASDVLYTRVIVDKNILNYYQNDTSIIITNSNYHNNYNSYNKVYVSTSKRHVECFNETKEQRDYYIRLNNNQIRINFDDNVDFRFIDRSRTLKLNKIINKCNIS